MSPDKNVESVRTKLLERSQAGLAKYGVTTERTDTDLAGWLNHLQQELMDAAVYVERTLMEAQSISTLQSEIALLKQQLEVSKDAIKSEKGAYYRDCWELIKQLAAAQATNGKMREAAESVCASLEHPTESVNAMQTWKLRDAISLPNDDTALKQYLDEVIEKCAEKCDGVMFAYTAQEEIRKLKGGAA